jgi:S1-C subfamily serine protease
MFAFQRIARVVWVSGLLCLWPAGVASAQVLDLNTGRIPTLAPLVREVTPAVVNISVQGRIREDNPLYQDPLFREFFEVPRQVEQEFSATELRRHRRRSARLRADRQSCGGPRIGRSDHDQGRPQVHGQAHRP